VIVDSAVTLCMTGAIAAFWLAAERAGGQEGRRADAGTAAAPAGPPARRPAEYWSIAGWAAIGLGILTKGPIALAVPLLVMIPYGLWRRRLAAILDPVGLLVFLAVVLPWVFAVSRQVPDFLRYVLVVETTQRLATGALGRAEAWWYFFPILLGAALPWSVVALAGLRRPARGAAVDPRAVLLACWIVVPLLFFTLSQSKRPQYVLPLVPAIALAVAHVRHRAVGWLSGARAAGAALLALGLGLLLAAGRLPGLFPASPETATLIPATARWVGATALAGGVAALVLARRPDLAFLALALPVLALPVAGLPLLSAIGRDRSSAHLAAAMRPFVGDRTEIVAIGVYPLSLPFYLRRTLTLATADGRELTSNYVPRRADLLRLLPGSPLRPPDWWEEAVTFCDRPRMFVARADARDIRQRLGDALPLLATSRKVAVYGPCGGDVLAWGVGSGERYVPRAGRPSRTGENHSPPPTPRVAIPFPALSPPSPDRERGTGGED
jgi:4-amino-4-deoxy-L-arabinose transferase-like glycosyltransferase